MPEQFANNAANTLNGAINNSTTSVVVHDASLFPTSGNFRILVDSEIMLVTAVAANTFTVTRGAEGSTAASHLDAADVTHVVTAGALGALRVGVGATVSRSTNTSIPDNTFTQVPFTTTDVDDHGFFTGGASDRLTVPSGDAGWYLVCGYAAWAANNAGQRRLSIRLNGTTVKTTNTFLSAAAGNDPAMEVSALLKLADADFVELLAFQNGIGSALNISAASLSLARWGG